MKVAFMGLGVMGAPMAGHLSAAGHEVTVYNRSQGKVADWLKTYAGTGAETPAEAAKNQDLVIACIGNDDDVREVTVGPQGAFATMAEGSVFMDHTTTSADCAVELGVAADRLGLSFLDAPVSGGEAGAVNGALTVMLGGTPTAYESVTPALDCYAKAHRLMGDVGAGQKTKMVNQIAIAGLVQGLSEALNFARSAGLDEMDVIDVISKGAAQSWQMDNRHETMIAGEFSFGFAVDLMRKDLGIVFAEAAANGAPLPVTELVDGFYEQVQDLGGGRWDTSSLIEVLRKNTQSVKN
ncbi:MAG: NAD(P)-dependent oxidoreductase [Parvibaculales bacterium]